MKSSQLSVIEPAPPQVPLAYPSSATAWYGMAVFFVGQIVATMDRQILTLVVEPVRRDLGITDVQIGLLQGLAFAIFYTTVGLLLGMVADVVSRRRLLIFGILVWSAATVASGFADSFAAMFACRLLVGLGEATLGPCAISIMADLFPAARRGRPMAVYLLGGSISGGLSIYITGLIMGLPQHALDGLPVVDAMARWRVTFLICGLLGLIVATTLAVMPEVERRGVRLNKTGGLGIAPVIHYFLAHRTIFLPFYLGLGCYSAGVGAVASWGVPFISRTFAVALPTIGQRLGPINMAMAVVGSLAAAVILEVAIRRAGVRGKLRLAPWLPLLALPCALVVFSPGPWTAFVFMAVPSLTLPLWGATLLGTVSELVPANMRGISVAVYAFAGTMIGGTLGPLMPAVLTEHVFHDPQKVGLSMLLVAAPALCLASIMLLLVQQSMGRMTGESELERVLAANEAP